MFPPRATIIEDSWMTRFARFLESAIPQHSLGFSVSALPRTNTTQITHASMTGSSNKYINLSSFATSVQMLRHTLQRSSSVDFCRHQWTCWRAWHSSRKRLVLKQNAVTLIISYWSLISALLKGLIMMFNWLCRTNKHGLHSYHSFLPFFCVRTLQKIARMPYCPFPFFF